MRCFCGLTGRSERRFRKKLQCTGSQYQEGMRVMCWCLCSAVKDVLEVLEMPARNPFEDCGIASSSLKGLEEELGSVKSIETFYCMCYQAIQVDLT